MVAVYLIFLPAVFQFLHFLAKTFYFWLFLLFWTIAIVINVEEHVIVVLICISLRIKDAEHLFHMLLGHWYIIFGWKSIKVHCPVLKKLFIF